MLRSRLLAVGLKLIITCLSFCRLKAKVYKEVCLSSLVTEELEEEELEDDDEELAAQREVEDRIARTASMW